MQGQTEKQKRLMDGQTDYHIDRQGTKMYRQGTRMGRHTDINGIWMAR